MRIVATSDTHFPFNSEKGLVPDGDVLIHAGDLMYMGTPDEWQSCSASFSNFQHEEKIFVPGNHDYQPFLYSGPSYVDLRKRGVRMLNSLEHGLVTHLKNGMSVLGLPWVTGLPGWAYNSDEETLYDLVMQLPKADIVVSHSPPKGILDNKDWGVRAWRYYQLVHKPAIWICGHIHEGYGVHAENGTEYYNVSMCNQHYEQVNKAAVINV